MTHPSQTQRSTPIVTDTNRIWFGETYPWPMRLSRVDGTCASLALIDGVRVVRCQLPTHAEGNHRHDEPPRYLTWLPGAAVIAIPDE